MDDNTATRLDLTKVDPDAGPPPALAPAVRTDPTATAPAGPPAAWPGAQPASVPGGLVGWLPPDVFLALVGNRPFIACACGWLVANGDVVENNNAHDDHECSLVVDVPQPPAAPRQPASPMSPAEAIMRAFITLVFVAGVVVLAYLWLRSGR